MKSSSKELESCVDHCIMIVDQHPFYSYIRVGHRQIRLEVLIFLSCQTPPGARFVQEFSTCIKCTYSSLFIGKLCLLICIYTNTACRKHPSAAQEPEQCLN